MCDVHVLCIALIGNEIGIFFFSVWQTHHGWFTLAALLWKTSSWKFVDDFGKCQRHMGTGIDRRPGVYIGSLLTRGLTNYIRTTEMSFQSVSCCGLFVLSSKLYIKLDPFLFPELSEACGFWLQLMDVSRSHSHDWIKCLYTLPAWNESRELYLDNMNTWRKVKFQLRTLWSCEAESDDVGV